MVNIFEIKNNIVKVMFALNLIFLVIYIFASSTAFVISILIVNIAFSGTLLMMSKFGDLFGSRGGPLGNLLGMVGGQLDSLMKTEDNDGQVQPEI